MPDVKISALTGATTPLAGTEVLPIVQSSSTVKVSVADLTAGRAVSAASLTTTGDVFVGTTSAGASERLAVVGATAASPVAFFVNSSAGSTLSGIAASITSGGNNTNSYHFAGVTETVALWYLYGNGTTSYTSDIRVKKNVTTTRDGYLDDVCKLRVVKYNWYNDSDDTTRELVLVATEVEQVLPGADQNDKKQTKHNES